MARAEGFPPGPADAEIPGDNGRVVGRAPTVAGDAARAAGLVAHQDLRADVAAVARGMASTVPGDVAGGAARAAAAGAGWVAGFMARLASGEWLDGSGWARLGRRLRLPIERQWSEGSNR